MTIRCDICGRFVSFGDIAAGRARRVCIEPDSHFGPEVYETECADCKYNSAAIVPGGILLTDKWHLGINDNVCSRCRQAVPDDQAALLLWTDDGENVLMYCEPCLGFDETA